MTMTMKYINFVNFVSLMDLTKLLIIHRNFYELLIILTAFIGPYQLFSEYTRKYSFQIPSLAADLPPPLCLRGLRGSGLIQGCQHKTQAHLYAGTQPGAFDCNPVLSKAQENQVALSRHLPIRQFCICDICDPGPRCQRGRVLSGEQGQVGVAGMVRKSF